jgi:hypothetical protein
MYAPEYQKSDLPYALLYTEKRLGGSALPSLERGSEISLPIRRVSFQGSTSQVITIYMPANGCLRVLDAARGDEITYGRQSRFLVDAIPLSDPSNILVDRNQTPRLPFSSEPEHTWCYYFAKSELAYQQADWKRVVVLIEEARSRGYQPEDPFEWMTYIEAQALTGNMEDAQELSTDILKQEKGLRKGLCELWKRVQSADAADAEDVTRLNQTLSDLQCGQAEEPPN